MKKEKLPKPFFDVPFKKFWYDEQLKKFLIQFMCVFEGMEVQIGKNDLEGKNNRVEIPIRRGNADRVVNSIIGKGTTASPLRLPLFAAEIDQIDYAGDKAKGVDHVSRNVELPVGGIFPDDLQVVYKKTPTPYYVRFRLNLLTSNDEQKFQVLEQIACLFNPLIQIQSTDDIDNWSKIAYLTLESMTFENAYPYGDQQKIINTEFIFSSLIYLQTPINYRQNFIKTIKLRMAQLDDTNYEYTDGYEEIANIDSVSEINNLID